MKLLVVARDGTPLAGAFARAGRGVGPTDLRGTTS